MTNKSIHPELKQYPKIENGKKVFVRYPVEIEQADLVRCVTPLTIGKWMAVEVALPSGFHRLVAPVQFDTEQLCRESCNIHNRFHGFDDDEVERIVSQSMGLKITKRRKKK